MHPVNPQQRGDCRIPHTSSGRKSSRSRATSWSYSWNTAWWVLPYVRCLVLISHYVLSDPLWPHGQQLARLPCPSPTPWVYLNSCSLSRWHHPTISFSVIPFSSHLPSFPASGSFPMTWFFASSGQSIGASAPDLPMNIQDWFSFRMTGLISLLSKGISRVLSNTTVQKHQFFGAQPSLWSNSHIHTWLLEKP